MNLRARCVLLSISICLSACYFSKEHYPAHDLIPGLVMPVTLNTDTTTLFINDFLVNEQWMDSFHISPSLKGTLSTDKKKLLIEARKTDSRLNNLRLYAQGYYYDILLKQSPKIEVQIHYKPSTVEKMPHSVELASELNGWTPANTPFTKQNDEWVCTLYLNPGHYQYQIVIDGKWMLDPANTQRADNNVGGFNSLLNVGNDDRTNFPQLITDTFNSHEITLTALNQPDSVFAYWQNFRINTNLQGGKIRLNIPETAKQMKESWLRVFSYNKLGESNDVLVPLSMGNVVESTDKLTQNDKYKTILYFLMVDRFKDGDPGINKSLNDKRVSSKADYQGGDLAGITQKIKDGYFTRLGINCIWISPITQNPWTAYQEYPQPRRWFSGYHGYWPITFTTIDKRFGNDAALDTLVANAHKRNIKVILDFVSNHVHQENPLYKNHPEYFTPVDLPDGRKNIRLWDEYRLTTWFDTFMPDIDYSKPEVVKLMVDSSVYWIKRFNLDGFRHDATKHVPEVFWRALTKKLKEDIIIPQHRDLLQIGETFGSRELIASYVSSGMQDAQFDFNLYFDARSVLAQDNTSFILLKNSMISSFNYYGWHSLMGNITGNHDITRFISLAGGAMTFQENDKEAGWSREIKVESPVGYYRLMQLQAFNMTIPGIPVIYYGDEIGEPGANDPDNRRMMRFDMLSQEEMNVKSVVERITNLRDHSMALLYGDIDILACTDTYLIYARKYFNNSVIVLFNKSRQGDKISITLPDYIKLKNPKALMGHNLDFTNNTLTLEMSAVSFDIIQ